MPKISSKQKNRKIVTSSMKNNKNNRNNNNINSFHLRNDLAEVKPSFPTTVTMKDLIRNAVNSYSRRSLPNAFFAYRMALINEYRIKNQPDYVKDSYKTLTRDAKSLYKQNQIVLDKNMNYIKQNNMAGDHVEVNQDTKGFSYSTFYC
ncbi:unnamed protein product [Rhizophagus irregularis]|nr:unnamed protein product [Rhizophagus irregularis]